MSGRDANDVYPCRYCGLNGNIAKSPIQKDKLPGTGIDFAHSECVAKVKYITLVSKVADAYAKLNTIGRAIVWMLLKKRDQSLFKAEVVCIKEEAFVVLLMRICQKWESEAQNIIKGVEADIKIVSAVPSNLRLSPAPSVEDDESEYDGDVFG